MDDLLQELHDALNAFLDDRLPALGLDVETYGPYIVPLLKTDDDWDADNDRGDEGDDQEHNEEDEEEWASVLDLLQASSETHSDNEEVWVQLKRDIQQQWREQCRDRRRNRHQTRLEHEKELEIQLEHERNLALQAAAAKEEARLAALEQGAGTSEEDVLKRALVDRFAYEEDDDDEGNGGAKSASTNDADGMLHQQQPLNNRDVAKQQALEKAQELRAHKQPTKKDEQQKTKDAKALKEKLKEDRKKRAVKGERRR